MNFYLALISTLFVISCSHQSYESKYIYAGRKDSLEGLAESYSRGKDHLQSKSFYMEELVNWNPQIKEWANIPRGSLIYLERPLSPFLMIYTTDAAFIAK